MAGDVRHFEIPYVKAYLAKRFHMTSFGWKLNVMPHDRNAMVEAPIASTSVNDFHKALEQAEQESGEVARERQTIGEMG